LKIVEKGFSYSVNEAVEKPVFCKKSLCNLLIYIAVILTFLVFLQRQRKVNRLRAFAESGLNVGLGVDMEKVIRWFVNTTVADWIARLGIWIRNKQMDEVRDLFR